jgi:hypothetical protein
MNHRVSDPHLPIASINTTLLYMQNVVKEKNVSWTGGGTLPASPALCNKQVCTYIGYCGRDLGQSLPHCQLKHAACSHHGASPPYIYM